jgi:extradiol dioxygenase family protein
MGQVGAFGIVIQSIELNRWYIFSLSVEQQNTELRVAIRCKFVQDVAKQSTMLLDLPSDSEISTRSALACNLTGESLTESCG